MTTSTSFVIRLASIAAGIAALSAPLAANAHLRNSNAQQLYQEALSACNAGQRTQSRADCMNEARSVLRDAREGRAWTLDGTSEPQLDRDTQAAPDQDRSQRRQERMNRQAKPKPVPNSPQ